MSEERQPLVHIPLPFEKAVESRRIYGPTYVTLSLLRVNCSSRIRNIWQILTLDLCTHQWPADTIRDFECSVGSGRVRDAAGAAPWARDSAPAAAAVQYNARVRSALAA